jgi:glycosyltransferase involved in cell wall biosynthesis
MRIALLDRGLAFDGARLREAPLGGAETAFVHLAEALAAAGHEVTALTAAARPQRLNAVEWRTLDRAPIVCDLAIISRLPALLSLAPGAQTKIMWLHNPARYLRKPRHLWPLIRFRPHLVTLGRYHAASVPRFVPRRGLHTIGLAVDPSFRETAMRAPPPPVAIFTSNPERGLDWLVGLWIAHIHPAVPRAELHVYAGAATYGERNAERIERALAQARAAHAHGVRLFAPLPKTALRERLLSARVMAYRGDPGETFCLAAAEAVALGVPVVTAGLGALAERIVEGMTGYCAPAEQAFAARVVALLEDDAQWLHMHGHCLAATHRQSWHEIAEQFTALGGLN